MKGNIMSFAIDSINANRAWFVPGFVVWGLPSLGQVPYLTTQTINGTTSVMYGQMELGPAEQDVLFSSLTDHRGNQLPSEINTPRVMLRPKESSAVFVVGTESNESFRIARDPDSVGSVEVDLMIVEIGD